jgi:FkbM family methyltransferase
MGLATVQFILNHPLSSKNKWLSFKRLISWQVTSRIIRIPMVIEFVNHSRLLMSTGMTGATGNFYAGLHEFEDMAFVLHALRADDLFVDVGANIGSYTVLAGAAVGATCIAIEPVLSTFEHLIDNVNLNGMSDRVQCLNIGIGKDHGFLSFSTASDTMNHVLLNDRNGNESGIQVCVERLDDVILDQIPFIIKIDVEGWETEVISGAQHTLESVSPLAVIMEFGNGKQYNFDEEEIHQKMLKYGFKVVSYEPFHRKLEVLNQRNSNGNTVYVKDVDFWIQRLHSSAKYTVLGTAL